MTTSIFLDYLQTHGGKNWDCLLKRPIWKTMVVGRKHHRSRLADERFKNIFASTFFVQLFFWVKYFLSVFLPKKKNLLMFPAWMRLCVSFKAFTRILVVPLPFCHFVCSLPFRFCGFQISPSIVF